MLVELYPLLQKKISIDHRNSNLLAIVSMGLDVVSISGSRSRHSFLRGVSRGFVLRYAGDEL